MLLIFLESSLLVPLSFTPDTEWESWAMTKAHMEDASLVGTGDWITGRKEEWIVHQEELFHFSSMI